VRVLHVRTAAALRHLCSLWAVSCAGSKPGHSRGSGSQKATQKAAPTLLLQLPAPWLGPADQRQGGMAGEPPRDPARTAALRPPHTQDTAAAPPPRRRRSCRAWWSPQPSARRRRAGCAATPATGPARGPPSRRRSSCITRTAACCTRCCCGAASPRPPACGRSPAASAPGTAACR
jgi:hypothetical protein